MSCCSGKTASGLLQRGMLLASLIFPTALLAQQPPPPTLEDAFSSVFNSGAIVHSSVRVGDHIWLGGPFGNHSTQSGYNRLARFTLDGALDTTVPDLRLNNTVNFIKHIGDHLYVGGRFTQVQNGTSMETRPYLIRLDANTGVLDTSFTFSGTDAAVGREAWDMLLQPDNKLIVVGTFQPDNDPNTPSPPAKMARLENNGTPDTSFTPPVFNNANTPYAVFRQPNDGKLLVGGEIGNLTVDDSTTPPARRNQLIRLNTNGTGDASFDAKLPPSSGFSYAVTHIRQGPGDTVYITGYFNTIDGQTRRGLARLHLATGALDADFTPNITRDPGNRVSLQTVVDHPDGGLLVGGRFTHADDQPYINLVYLDDDGRLNDLLPDIKVTDAAGSGTPEVHTLLPLDNHRLLIGGSFQRVLDQERNAVALIGLPSYTVTANVSGTGGSVSPAMHTVGPGLGTSLTLAADANHVVDQANVTSTCGTGSFNAAGTQYSVDAVNADCEITFRFLPLHSLTAEVHFGGVVSTTAGSFSCTPNPVQEGGQSTCTYTPAAGYELESFTGCTATATANQCELTVNASTTVIANARVLSHPINITVMPAPGGTVNCNPNPVPHGSNSTCTVTPSAGYTFSSFSGACNGATCQLNNVTAPMDVTATFTGQTYTINTTANPAAGGSVSCTPANPVPHGSDVTCTATANPGYAFDSFSGDCNGGVCELNNLTADANVTANFNVVPTYTITATANPAAAGSVTCVPGNPVTQGADVTCTATANTGYVFDSFSGACNGNVCVLNNVMADASVIANFNTVPTYTITITANPANAGQVNCDPNPVTEGGSTTCTATANAGYTFDGFSGACNGDVCVLNNVMADAVVAANFIANSYTITPVLSVPGSGNFSCAPNPVPHGQSARCTFVPAPGYVLEGFENCTAVAGEPNVCDTGPLQMGDIQVTARARLAAGPAPVLVPVNHPLTQLLLLLALSSLALFALQRRGQ